MQSNTVELTKRDFIIEEELLSKSSLICWEKKEAEFNIHIFSSSYKSRADLLANYEEVRDYIAMYFQSQTLVLDIERWNIYEFLFVSEKLPDELKQKIEQDKYSTRKIIVDYIPGEIDEEMIQVCIIQELFTFEIVKRQIDQESIAECLNKEHKNVMDLIGLSAGRSNDEILQILINKLGHAEN